MDWENLPLPPNWETRFDDSSRRWFFINHSTKSTTWEDPRPAYYASEDANTPQSTNRTSRRKQKRLQCDHGFSSESPSASESPYSLPDTDDERNSSEISSDMVPDPLRIKRCAALCTLFSMGAAATIQLDLQIIAMANDSVANLLNGLTARQIPVSGVV
ncbi:WW domain protein [Opisthorchis viverrini]|uniref:WW domain protein n=1 Tax=Opisthorchis viverrini TaxID=6198 RepID=A0A1S8WP00_OPIVI|nr:WW domain protein [Opisthorchis viverrini]